MQTTSAFSKYIPHTWRRVASPWIGYAYSYTAVQLCFKINNY